MCISYQSNHSITLYSAVYNKHIMITLLKYRIHINNNVLVHLSFKNTMPKINMKIMMMIVLHTIYNETCLAEQLKYIIYFVMGGEIKIQYCSIIMYNAIIILFIISQIPRATIYMIIKK